MIDLGPGLDDRRLGLDKISDLRAVAQRRSRPQPREGADRSTGADRSLLYVREGVDHRAVANADS